MTYAKQTWADGNPSYPVNAARMNVLEQGVYDAHYKPFCRLRHSTNFACPSATAGTAFSVIHPWDTEDADPFNMHDTVVNNSRVVLLARGLYAASFLTQMASTATQSYEGFRIVANSGDALSWNPTFPVIAINMWGTANTVDMVMPVMGTFYCTNPGVDYLQAQIYQGSGASRNIIAAAASGPAVFAVWLVTF